MSAAKTLLRSYPLSRMCLEILGKKLLDSLEYGVFSPEFEIIKQGEKGKDLFLLCNHMADVIVFKKIVVQMETPTLVGDKGIIDRNSVRTATISISKGKNSLVIKIPMGKFIRIFITKGINDSEYRQEIRIFYNLFKEIQGRLFKYANIQKNLWEEINTRLNSLNVQLITNIINNKDEKEWEPKVWGIIKQFLISAYRYKWPDDTDINVASLNEVIKVFLERSFPRKNYKGSDQNYDFHKQLLWKKNLDRLSEILVKVLPADQLPISVGEIELFNPLIYRMRISKLIRSIEKKFMFKKVKPREKIFDHSKLKSSQFFDKSVDNSEFNLNGYIKIIREQFVLNKPNRVSAQIAQQTAQLTATSENEFNVSVSKMQHFLEKIQKISNVDTALKSRENNTLEQIEKNTAILNKGFKAYNKRMIGLSYTHSHIGEIKFSDSMVPNISEILRSCGSDHVKKNIEKAFQNILDITGLNIKGLNKEGLQELFFICEASSDDKVFGTQLSTHHWIPISDGIKLKKGEYDFMTMKPGTIIGGEAWHVTNDDEVSKENQWRLVTPKRQGSHTSEYMFVILVIPNKKLPWIVNPEPLIEKFEKIYIPVLQWMIDKNLEYLMVLSQLRDILFNKYAKVAEIVLIEKKVQEFEKNQAKLSDKKHDAILKMVSENLGIKLEKKKDVTTEQVSKQLYNAIITQTKKGFPRLNIEEQGNKAYTLWRFMQSEIISLLFMKDPLKQIKLEKPHSIFSLLDDSIKVDFIEYSIKDTDELLHLSDRDPRIQLLELLNTNSELLTDQRLKISLSIISLTEIYVRMLIEESNHLQNRLKKISGVETQFDAEEIQSKVIFDSIARLQSTIGKEIDSTG